MDVAKGHLKGTATSILFSLILIAPLARADVVTVYNGTECNTEYVTVPGSGEPWALWFRNTGLYGSNPTTVDESIICPVPRNVESPLQGTGLQAHMIKVYRPTGTSFTCYYRANAIYAGSGTVWTSGIPEAGSGNKTIYMGGLPVTSGNEFGAYSLRCIVPPGGRIYSYVISEDEF